MEVQGLMCRADIIMSAQHHVLIMTLLTMVRDKVRVKPIEAKELRSLLYHPILHKLALLLRLQQTLLSIVKTHQLLLGGKNAHLQCNLIHE